MQQVIESPDTSPTKSGHSDITDSGSTLPASKAVVKRVNPFAKFKQINENKIVEKTAELARAQSAAEFARAQTHGPDRSTQQTITSITARRSDPLFDESGDHAVIDQISAKSIQAKLGDPASRLSVPDAYSTSQKIMVAAQKFEESSKPARLNGGFEALAMAHRKFGQNAAPPAHTSVKDAIARPGVVPPTRRPLPTRDVLIEEANRDAGIMRAMVLLNGISGYYEISDDERANIRQRLTTMDVVKLGAMIKSYEFAFSHVAMMTDDKLARRAAIEDDKSLRQFFEKNGTYDDVPDHSNAIDWVIDSPTVATKPTGKIKKAKR